MRLNYDGECSVLISFCGVNVKSMSGCAWVFRFGEGGRC